MWFEYFQNRDTTLEGEERQRRPQVVNEHVLKELTWTSTIVNTFLRLRGRIGDLMRKHVS